MKIYHYTSAQGALGLLKNGKFWATEINFMNDHRELNEGSDIYELVINELASLNIKKLFNKDKNVVFENTGYMVEFANTLLGMMRKVYSEHVPINVVSFSTDEDYIRQWMSYCPSNSGYCIEFDKLKLESVLKKINRDTYIQTVIYSDSETKDTLVSKFKSDLTLLLNNPTPNEEVVLEKISEFLGSNLAMTASIKPQQFQDEKEIRVVTFSFQKELSMQSYRERNGVIIPYIEIPYPIEAITKIIIGPSSNQELAKKGLEILKFQKGFKFKIALSECSLRQF